MDICSHSGHLDWEDLRNWRETSGGMLRYWFRQGEGPCLVLIHEMGGSIESWDKVLAHLDTEHPVLASELR